MNLLTLIVPISNMENKLDRLKLWIEDAVKLNIEVIIVHDIGHDDTGTELRRIVNNLNSNSLKLIEGKFGGPGLARNAGMNQATSSYLNFTDSDDQPNLLELLELSNLLKEVKKPIGVGGYEVAFGSPPIILSTIKFGKFDLVNFAKVINQLGIWRFVFLNDRIQGARFGSEKMGEDQIFIADLQIARQEVQFFKKNVYTYYVGNSFQLTNNDKAKSTQVKSLDELILLTKNSQSFLNFGLFFRLRISWLIKNFKTSLLIDFFKDISKLYYKLNSHLGISIAILISLIMNVQNRIHISFLLKRIDRK
jgi:glycosyltransferase involved in cell wall biosynthesis